MNANVAAAGRTPDAGDVRTIALVIPVFDDWDSLTLLIDDLNKVLGSRGWRVELVLVDDGSNLPIPDALRQAVYRQFSRVEVVHLRRNLGHQRAIAVGLTHLWERRKEFQFAVVMDGDGEDRAEDVPALVESLALNTKASVLFAARTKRLEHWSFRLMYRLYRFTHWLLTGVSVRVGNFSALRPDALPRLVVASELWNHYAAAVFRSRMPFQTTPITRGRRYRGRSQMNFHGLVLHGLSAISVFSDIVGVRLLLATMVLMIAAAALLGVVLVLRFVTPLAIPGWATSAAGLLVIVLVQSLLLMLISSFIILSMRSHLNVIPLRDASIFIDRVERLV